MTRSGNLIRKDPLTPTQTAASGIWTLDQAQAAVKNNTWPVSNGVSRSLRFNSADSAYLSRTPASAGNRKTWTWSGWVKYTVNDNGVFNAPLFWVPDTGIMFEQSPNTPHRIYVYNTGEYIETTQFFRDASSWYHIVAVIDNTQATAADRTKLYINGVQVTAFAVATYPALNADGAVNAAVEHNIGRQVGLSRYFNGYMTDINFIDGLALTPSDFAFTDPDSNQWRPKRYSGSYGANGFYLDFSDNSSPTNLGLDRSGNANHWTASGFSVTTDSDSVVDTPTNYNFDFGAGGEVRGNYATLNPLDTGPSSTFSNGNLSFTYTGGASHRLSTSTIGMSSGKWYWEGIYGQGGTAGSSGFGIAKQPINLSDSVGQSNVYSYHSNGNKYVNGSDSSFGSTYTTADLIGIAFNADTGELFGYKNGVLQGTIATGLTAGPYFAVVNSYNSSSWQVNFGQRPFAYAAPEGFKCLCSTNLPEPTIRDGGEYFNTVLYTGTGATQSITGVGFEPDFVWFKSRSGAFSHFLVDQVRGNTKYLSSNVTDAETTNTNRLTSFDSDGFTLGDAGGSVNGSGQNIVAWNWRANGAGVSNTAGSISSTVSANTDSGFSIVTYTGNGTGGATVGHGLGIVPDMIIIKNRDNTPDWLVYHSSTGNLGGMFLNRTDAFVDDVNYFNDTSPTSSLFTAGSNDRINTNAEDYVAYCFAEVEGFSKFGSFVGNNSTDGVFLYLGFRPAFLLFKRSSSTSDWTIFDSVRGAYNANSPSLAPNVAATESAITDRFDIVSNGVKFRSASFPNDGATIIFAAFAESPFKYSRAR